MSAQQRQGDPIEATDRIDLSRGERLASLETLAVGVAHEINTPLASVLAAAEALRHRLVRLGVGVTPDVEALLDALEREMNRLRAISDKLMLLVQQMRALDRDSERPTLAEMERRYIRRVLEENLGHRQRAAKALGISERNLYRKLKALV